MNLVVPDETAISPSEVFLDGESITEHDLYAQCDYLLKKLDETGNPDEVDNAIDNLIGVQVFSGKALSRLICGQYAWYTKNNPTGNYFQHYTEKHGGKQITVQRHVSIGNFLLNPEIPEEIKARNSRDILPIAKALEGGYEIDNTTWEELERAEDDTEIRDILRKTKGKEPRKGSMQIYMEEDGTLTAWMDGKPYNVGWLNLPDAESNQVTQKAINRIVENTGIMVK
jgi:hypothetical protein